MVRLHLLSDLSKVLKTTVERMDHSPRQRSAGKADGPAQDRSFGDLAAEADRKLFRAVVTDPRHVLSRLNLSENNFCVSMP